MKKVEIEASQTQDKKNIKKSHIVPPTQYTSINIGPTFEIYQVVFLELAHSPLYPSIEADIFVQIEENDPLLIETRIIPWIRNDTFILNVGGKYEY